MVESGLGLNLSIRGPNLVFETWYVSLTFFHDVLVNMHDDFLNHSIYWSSLPPIDIHRVWCSCMRHMMSACRVS